MTIPSLYSLVSSHVTPKKGWLPDGQQGNGHHSHGIWPRLNSKFRANLGLLAKPLASCLVYYHKLEKKSAVIGFSGKPIWNTVFKKVSIEVE